jgi:hypothetical protein
MTDDQLVEHFHRIELRMERFEERLDGLEKRVSDGLADVRGELRTRFEGLEKRVSDGLADVRGELRTRFEGLESRLKDKADWRVLGLYTALILGLMTVYAFLV